MPTGINAVVDALERCEKTNSRNEKMAALMDPKLHPFLKTMFNLTMNPYLTYRQTVKEPPYLGGGDILPPGYLPDQLADFKAQGFFRVLEDIAESTSVASLQALVDAFPPYLGKWMARVVNRDLKCGVSWGTVEAMFGKTLIPTFDVQLALPYEGQELGTQLYYAEPKFDGLRCIAFKRGGAPWQFLSRNGKPLWNMELIAADLDKLNVFNVVLDGEAWAGSFNKSISVTKTQSDNHPLKKLLRFYPFDIMNLAAWEARECKMQQIDRIQMLEYHYNNVGSVPGTILEYVRIPDRIEIASAEDAVAMSREWISQGYEGAVVKRANAMYSWARTDNWLKLKDAIEADCKILDVMEGKGKFKGLLGSILIETPSGEQSWCGSGFLDIDRRMLWELHKQGKLVGMTAEVIFQEKTEDGSLRFPRYSRMRPDK